MLNSIPLPSLRGRGRGWGFYLFYPPPTSLPFNGCRSSIVMGA